MSIERVCKEARKQTPMLLRASRNTARYFFEVHLSLGDRMLLRQIMEEVHAGNEKIRSYFGYCAPIEESTVRFMAAYFSCSDMRTMDEVAHGYPNVPLMKQLTRNAFFYDYPNLFSSSPHTHGE